MTIGGTAATSVTVVSSTSITAKTPAHAAGAADVAVKNTDNQSGALSGGYTYTSSSGGGSGAPAGATFYDDFSKGSLDTSKWIPSNWSAPGGGSFVPSYLDFSTGMLTNQSHADLQLERRDLLGRWRVAIQKCAWLRNL